MGAAKEEFLREFGEHYGYPNGPKSIDHIRATEFKRLQDLVYLDHAGATLYSELQMESVFNDFTTNVYGNPHSQSDSSSATLEIVKNARQQVLDYCNASPRDYKCIFTSGATAALKLVGEAFPWSCNSNFMYTTENHNSVLGIREYALDQGAAAIAVDIEEDIHPGITGEIISTKISPHQVQKREVTGLLEGEQTECNFSGFRFGLNLVKIIKEDSSKISGISSVCQNGQWMVLIDAAKGCATMPIDLSKYPADFVVISFYKLFGYPTGLGALIVRNDAAKLLKKTYFSGGTVAASIADIDFIKRREGIEELFEDGTVSFLSIVSLRHGFKILNSLTVSAISRHTTSLALYTRKMLLALRHGNGSSVCILYGHHNSMELCEEMGPIVSFNLKRPDGSWYGYHEVEKLASLSGIQLRTGCFCNPGACAKYLGLSHLDLISNTEAGHVCWDDHDIINGKPIGAVRVSFGYMSTYEDAKKFVDFVASSFISPLDHIDYGNQLKGLESFMETGYYLKSITIYPIKSCGGFSARSWPLSINGLKHDRQWILKSLTGEVLTQKKVPEMCYISTSIDLSLGMLYVESPCCKEKLQIRLESDVYDGAIVDVELYGQRYKAYSYNSEIDAWFSEAVGKPCTLLRYSNSNQDSVLNKINGAARCRDTKNKLNFANEGQFLLVSEESVSDLNKRLSSNVQNGTSRAMVQVSASRFRPNLVVSGGQPYAEDGWRYIRIGNKYFNSLGGCNRCQMINLALNAGQVQKSNEPLATLASYRRVKQGKILFGILLKYASIHGEKQQGDSWLHVGQEVNPDKSAISTYNHTQMPSNSCPQNSGKPLTL
ncbi:molybdenum cofactor sulfurase isoform X2 [Abrus precatorius]|uniref:Molybdenum cofactor sulfurase n=1 Tax=Abrus precatorius TaxID=3816 RepID=A0A8B8LME4_ABRPR|nr:molybdenum cofactor sulfurase isoform X2 [Abrus precatorius]